MIFFFFISFSIPAVLYGGKFVSFSFLFPFHFANFVLYLLFLLLISFILSFFRTLFQVRSLPIPRLLFINFVGRFYGKFFVDFKNLLHLLIYFLFFLLGRFYSAWFLQYFL